MVLVFSQHSNASPQIRREVERAVHNNVIILPFRIEELPLNPSLELFLGAAHWLDVADMPRDRAIEALVGSVTKLVKGVDPTPVPPPAPPAPPPRPPDVKNFKAVYIAAIVFSVALTVVVYVFAFDRFGETEMVYLSPIWWASKHPPRSPTRSSRA